MATKKKTHHHRGRAASLHKLAERLEHALRTRSYSHPKKKRKKAKTARDWPGHKKAHSKAAKKGHRRAKKKKSHRDPSFYGHSRKHAKAAKKGWHRGHHIHGHLIRHDPDGYGALHPWRPIGSSSKRGKEHGRHPHAHHHGY